MKKLEFQSGPVLLCLLIGIVTAFLVARPKPVSHPPDALFMEFVARAHSNIVYQRDAATNGYERAAWQAIEKRFTNFNWLSVAATTRHSNSNKP